MTSYRHHGGLEIHKIHKIIKRIRLFKKSERKGANRYNYVKDIFVNKVSNIYNNKIQGTCIHVSQSTINTTNLRRRKKD